MSLGLCYKLSEFSKHCQVQKIFLKIKNEKFEKTRKSRMKRNLNTSASQAIKSLG